jgi:hypothetical protein
VFFQVSERDPDAARLTRDVDVALGRNDLQRIAKAAEDFGFRYQRSAGVISRVLMGNRSLTVAARNERFRTATVRERSAEHHISIDMLVDAKEPKARSAVHLLFVRERVRPDYLEPVPGFSEPTVTAEGILLAPVSDLLRMKLTSFRLRDKTHVIDMDSVGLITPEIEAALPDSLRRRLQQVREEEAQSTGAE